MVVTLKPHQVEVVKQLDNGKIMYGDVGVGKSITAAFYYMEKEAPKPVYVITTAKKRDSLDWEKEFVKLGVAHDHSLAGPLTVDSWNNLHHYKDVTDAFFIFDEQRAVGYGSWSKNFIHIAKHNRWILLSATPGDTWMDYIPVFIANGWYKNKTDFVRQHVEFEPYVKHPKVRRYHGVAKLVRLRNQLLVHMPYERHTTRETYEISVGYDQALLKKVVDDRWHVYENRPIRNVSELFSVTRRVVNSDPSRLAVLQHLMEKHPRLIVFYNFDYELEILRSLAEEITPTSASPKGAMGKTASNSVGMTSSGSKSKGDSTRQSPSRFLSSANKNTTDTSGSTNMSTTDSTTSTVLLAERNEKEKGKWPTRKIIQSPTSAPTLNRQDASSLGGMGTGKPLKKQSGKSPGTRFASTSSPTSSLGGTTVPAMVTSGSDLPKPTTSVPIAEWNGHKHEPIPKTDRWVYLVQYTSGSEGWNCIETDAMVFYSLTYSWRQFYQAHGRIDRLDTPFKTLKYYVLKSESWFDKAVWKALTLKKTFNEMSYFQKNLK